MRHETTRSLSTARDVPLTLPDSLFSLSASASRALFWRLRHLPLSPWLVHVPFAFWLIETCRPRRFVELGVGGGCSYFAFCQAVDKLGLATRCTGIDFWGGDASGAPDAATRERVGSHNQTQYREFSTLHTENLVGAETRFQPSSIDLLHVDVTLTPAVIDSLLHDWAPKLSRRAVVLIHGIATHRDTPAVAGFFDKIRARYRSFVFEHGDGLLVALIGTDQPEKLARLVDLEPGSADHSAVAAVFHRLGIAHHHEARIESDTLRSAALESELAAAQESLRATRDDLAAHEADLASHRAALAARNRQAAEAQARLFDREGELAESASALAARDAEIARLSEALADLGNHRHRLAAERTATTEELEQERGALQAALAEREQRLERLEAENAMQAEDIRARFSELATLTARLEAERNHGDETAETLRAAKTKLAEERVAREKLRSELTAERTKRKRLQSELARLLSYGRQLEARHCAVLESETWRAMEPARRLIRLIKGRRPPPVFTPQLDRIALNGLEPLAEERELGKPEIRHQIARAFEKARGSFREAGIAELEAIRASRKVDAANRLAAARSLVLLRAESAAERELALARLEAMDVWRSDARGPCEAAMLRLSLLEGLGRNADVERLVATAPDAVTAHPDFLLLAASRSTSEAGAARIAAISAAFRASAGVDMSPIARDASAMIDNLQGAGTLRRITNATKISVIIPAFNCADTIRTSLRSISHQTWKNLEILVVDDASTDATAEIVTAAAANDQRIKLIRLLENGGAYCARNTALAEAKGDFVTCQDADDWSHPERLRRQVEHLRANPHLVANVSHWARATPDLRFERRAFSPRVVHFNSSSIMFQREPVLERAGFWDSVRFGADTEFWHRLRTVFGEEAVAELPELLAIGRIRETSLSRASASAYVGGKMGARKAYEHAYRRWHETAGPEALRLGFPLAERPFAVPTVMRTGRSRTGHFDVVLISDFRHMGGTTSSNQQELVAQRRAGLRTAVVQVDRYDFNVTRGIHPDIQALIDDGSVEQLVYGDDVSCDLAVVRFPPIFSHRQDYLPAVRPKSVRVVVNQPPRRVAGAAPFYSIAACKANIAAYLGQPGSWVPIGPAVRDALAADGEAHHLSPEDWFNIIDVDAWTVARDSWCAERPVIGRHGRDAPEKWLTRKEDLLGAYPDNPSVAVRIMGGADIPTRIIGHRPANWEVLPFNAMEPRDFLASLDFFVFFPHEGRIEAFGRTIIEAMASGCLAILPPVFAPLFGEAAIYCAPAEVGATVARFRADREASLAQTARAEAIVRARFGFERHLARIRAAMPAGALTEAETETVT